GLDAADGRQARRRRTGRMILVCAAPAIRRLVPAAKLHRRPARRRVAMPRTSIPTKWNPPPTRPAANTKSRSLRRAGAGALVGGAARRRLAKQRLPILA